MSSAEERVNKILEEIEERRQCFEAAQLAVKEALETVLKIGRERFSLEPWFLGVSFEYTKVTYTITTDGKLVHSYGDMTYDGMPPGWSPDTHASIIGDLAVDALMAELNIARRNQRKERP